MKTWEEIIKDKLGKREIPLSDESIAEFHAKLDGMASTPAEKHFPFVWIAAAVAACLAAIVILRHPAEPQPVDQTALQPSAPVAIVPDSTTVNEPEQSMSLISQAVKPKVVLQPYVEPQEQIIEPAADDAITEEMIDTSATKAGIEPPVTVVPPFVPEVAPFKTAKMNVGSATGIIAGGGLLAAITTPFVRGAGIDNGVGNNPVDGSATNPNQNPPEDELSGKPSHCLPMKMGLSLRIPVAGRLNLTTGVEYSLYSSKLTYTLSGEKTQLAHYIGIPLRLDWTIASNRWLDVYAGGGIEGDYCIGATLAGEPIQKDGFGLSLLGAGGVQLNLNKRIGLYMEPEISWIIPSEYHVLNTYRTNHPLTFSLAGGIRISLGV